MSNIGYGVFKMTSNFTIDSNGILENLNLQNHIIVDSFEPANKMLLLKRIGEAYLVVLMECVKKNNQQILLGSAISFKEFEVDENKIIDGVQYLLSQLKKNFEDENNIETTDLGVVLPSTTKDFKIFKTTKLIHQSNQKNKTVFDIISFNSQEIKKYLQDFCVDKKLSEISCLWLTPNESVKKILDVRGIKHINTPKEPVKVISKPISKEIVNNSNTETKPINKIPTDKPKKNNIFKILSIVFLGVALFLGYLLMTKEKDNNSIFPIGEDAYISYTGTNVSVRSDPFISSDNLKNILADGDKIHLIGFDKNTLWAKIRYDDGEIGYMHNRFVSKKIKTDRVRSVYKKAVIYSSRAPIYRGPNNNETIGYLIKKDEILVKNEILKQKPFYSFSFKKNGKTIHGYIPKGYFEYK